jgi:diguanylate cyclase
VAGIWTRLARSYRATGSLLRLSGLTLLIAVLATGCNAVDPVLPWPLVWLPGTIGSFLVVIAFRRTARAGHLPAPTRRLWRHLFVVAVLVLLGSVSQAIEVLRADDPAGAHVAPLQMAFDGAAILVIIWALLRLPLGRQSRGEVFRVLLDAGTVMLGCAVFVWHFTTRFAIRQDDPRLISLSLVLTVLALVAVFALAKVLLTSHSSYLDGGSLRMIGAAVLIGAVSPVFRPLLELIDPNLYPDMVNLPAIFFFGVLAAERQRRSDYGRRRGVPETRRRSFSVLPYVAIAAVDALLLSVTLPAGVADREVVVVSAVILTAVVVVRQVHAFRDNGRLLHRLDHSATHDSLTQLPNRALFHERLQKALAHHDHRPVCVALIDLDDFKIVNDTLGHEVGDRLLVAVAQRLSSCIRVEDTVARLGGDEFVVVLDGADPGAADLAAERIIDALVDPVRTDGHVLPVRASIGLADGRAGDDASVLLRRADIAMYAAKLLPGTAHLHFTPAMAQAGTEQSNLDLSRALELDQLVLHYQPIVDLGSGRVRGVEALLRWQHPTHGRVLPTAFLPAAERTGLIVPITRWVLRTALAQVAGWGAELELHVNISHRDLREADFPAVVAALLDEAAIAPDRLTLELSAAAADLAGLPAAVARLRELGVRIALDSFGTGPAGLTMLQEIPADRLKLGRPLTRAAETTAVPLAAGVRELARTLGLDVVAAGVETPAQAARLAELGYGSAQGFHFGHPMPAEDLGAVLATPVGAGSPAAPAG